MGVKAAISSCSDPSLNINTGNGCGLCLEIHDLAVAKLAAGREKDCCFVSGLLKHKLADASVITSLLRQTPLAEELSVLAVARLRRLSP